VAALSVSAPSDRHDPDWALQVKKTADAVSHALGYTGLRK
jgi:DNA-binding IclR family transcriptional regulator